MRTSLSLAAAQAVVVASKSFNPSPAFPVPDWHQDDQKALSPLLDQLRDKLSTLAQQDSFANSSFSIEVTSGKDTLWRSNHHSAQHHNKTRPGVTEVDGNSIYRIASITKTFTVLGILYQHALGNLHLDAPVTTYIPELTSSHGGSVPWQDITLRSLASQLSGIPRDFDSSEVALRVPDPVMVGFPPLSDNETFRACEAVHDNGFPSCTESEFLSYLTHRDRSIFPPNLKSTYSNDAFDLLGIVLANVSNSEYSEYISSAILDPLGMTSTSFDKPSDDRAVIPVGENWWDSELGINRPTGGLYASSCDMSKYLRHVLTNYNSIARGVNWFQPQSWATGRHTYYGMPWEIYRSDEVLLESKRPVDFVTKWGGLPGYYSSIALLPGYGLGVTILAAGRAANNIGKLVNTTTVTLARAAEEVIWEKIAATHSGSYVAVDSAPNSSLELESSPSSGLLVTSFISNGMDVGAVLGASLTGKMPRWQLTPTYLYKDEATKQGEVWMMVDTSDPETSDSASLWDDFCPTDIDSLRYGGLPTFEVVFWLEEGTVEVSAFRLMMKRREEGRMITQEART